MDSSGTAAARSPPARSRTSRWTSPGRCSWRAEFRSGEIAQRHHYLVSFPVRLEEQLHVVAHRAAPHLLAHLGQVELAGAPSVDREDRIADADARLIGGALGDHVHHGEARARQAHPYAGAIVGIATSVAGVPLEDDAAARVVE